MSQQHVAFCCAGEKGLRHLAVAVLSLFDTHTQPSCLRVHLVWEGLSEHSLSKLRESWQEFDSQVTFYRASGWLGERALEHDAGFWFRTWLGDILPPEIDRVLYLDYDVMVLRDISPLWDMDMDGRLVAAVEDPLKVHSGYAQGLARLAEKMGATYGPEDQYFNSGVLFIDLESWRDLDVGRTLAERFGPFRSQYKQFHDQDELNLLFRGKVLLLAPSWNLIEDVWLYQEWPYLLYSQFGSPEKYFQAYICHFSGPEKADGRWRRASHKNLYYKYLDRTPWAGWRTEFDRTWTGRQMAQLLDLHYLVVRGIFQQVIPVPWKAIGGLIVSNPLLPFLYISLPLYRLWRRLRNSD